MNRILLSIFFFLTYTAMSHAQYTDIINPNKPGYTNTPYTVGTDVLQFENTLSKSGLDNQEVKTNSISNDLNIHYGFWLHRLEASLIHKFTFSDIAPINRNITGTEMLSVGFKYLLYEHSNKDNPDIKRSWKKRYGFRYNGLIPSIAISTHVNTPLTNKRFTNNTTKTSFSTSIIAENNIAKGFIVNNQIELNNLGGELREFVYAMSSSYVVARRFNPYLEFRYHNIQKTESTPRTNYINLGIGTPFLVTRNLSVAIHYNITTDKNISGNEFGIGAAFRIDNHHDGWVYKDVPEEEETPKIGTEDKRHILERILQPKNLTKKVEKAKKKRAKKKKKDDFNLDFIQNY